MKIAVTGASGFIGSHLTERLSARGDKVSAWRRPGKPPPVSKMASCAVDLAQTVSIAAAFNESGPDAVVHLAAQSLPSESWKHPLETMQFNVASALNLFEAARETGFSGPILIAGSSSEYAAQHDPATPMAEDHPIGAGSPYAASKIAVDQLAQLYHQRYGLKIIRVRPFFWIGPRKTGDFSSDMARRIVETESGRAACVKTGNLDAVRDLLDVRDGVEALHCLIERGQPGEAYNVCSGTGYRLHDILQMYLRIASKPVRTEADPSLLRPLDEPVRIGNPRKIIKLGWKPQRAIEDTIKDILQFWRQQGS